MKVFRSVLFWAHLAAGVSAAVIILIMSVTGVALTYQRQMQYWADTRHYRTEPAAGAERLSVDDLVARAEVTLGADKPMRITAVTYRSDRSLPVALSAGNRTYYANPFSGEVYGEATGQRMRAFFGAMVNWHRWLAMSGDDRPTGRSITGAANLLFLFIVLSGMYLWWPRALTWSQIRNVTWFRRNLPAKARDFNWHNVLGFWSAIPLALVVYSGVVISYPWASNGVYRLMGERPPAPAARASAGAPQPAQVAALDRTSGPALSVFLATAESHVAQWNILSLRLPASTGDPVVATIDLGDGGQPHLRGTLTLDGATGAVQSWAPFSDQTPGRQLRSLLRFAHTGEAGGLTGQTIAGLVSAFAAVLVYTGLALSLRRLLAWFRRRRSEAMPVSPAGQTDRAA